MLLSLKEAKNSKLYYGYIYIITNLINLKIYIGQKKFGKFPSEDENYWGSGTIIKQAIKKNGIENFKKDIIEYYTNPKEGNEYEIHWIKFYNSTDLKIGYNISFGGGSSAGLVRSEELRKRIGKTVSEFRLGIPQPKVECPHCGKISGQSTIKRYHFDNCFKNPDLTEERKTEIENAFKLSREKCQ